MIGGSPVTVTMSTPGETGTIYFDGTANQIVSIDFTGNTVPSFYDEARLYDPSGNLISTAAVSGAGYCGCGLLDHVLLPVSGQYRIVYDPNASETGSVNAQGFAVTDANVDFGLPEVAGESYTFVSGVPGTNMYITFTGTAGRRISLRGANSSFDEGGFDGHPVTVKAPSGAIVMSGEVPDATWGGVMDLGPTVLPETGQYTIFFNPRGRATGQATFTLWDVIDTTVTIGAPTETGTSYFYSSQNAGAILTVLFPGTAGKYLSFMDSGDSFWGTSRWWDGNWVYIYGPSGQLLASREIEHCCEAWHYSILRVLMPETGTYRMVFDPLGAATGSATMIFWDASDVAFPIQIDGAGASNVAMRAPGARMTFPFYGSAYQPVRFSIQSNANYGASSGVVVVENEVGQEVTPRTDLNNFGDLTWNVTLPGQSGNYRLVIDPPATYTIGTATVTAVTNGAYMPPEQADGTCDGRGFHALAASECLSDPVNTLTGAFTTSETDLTLAAPGVPFAFTRTYTSRDASVGRLGRGWTDNAAVSLEIQADANIVLHGDEGQRVRYTRQANGSYVGANGSLSTLSAITGGYKLIRHDQVTYVFDSQGRVTSEKDRNGQGLTFVYDGQGRLSSITDAAGHVITLGYNASNLLASVATPDGRTVTYGYTGGLLTSVTLPDPDGAGPLTAPVTRYTYDAGERLATVVDPLNHTQVSNVYDASTGRVTQQTDANGKTTLFAWDAATQTATVTDANQHVWKDVYASNILLKRIDATNKETVFAHDTDLNTTQVTSPNGTDRTAMTYDTNGNLLTATAPASLNSVQKVFTYTSLNDVDTVRDARGKLTDYGYDPAGNNTSISLEGQQIFGATHNAQGQMLTSTDGNGKATTYTYDANGNVASVTAPDPDGAGPLAAAKTTYTYDAMGNVLTRVDPLGNCPGCTPANYRTTFTYDELGRLLTETDPLGHVTRHSYDAADNRISTTDPNNHTTTHEYDNANRLVQTTGPDPDGAGPQPAPVSTYTYDDVGNRLTEVGPRGNIPGCNCAAAHTTTYTYDANNRLASVTTPKGEKTTYTYDADGNLATIVDPRGNVQGANPAEYTATHTYDAAGRLKTTTDPLSNTTTNSYDPVGNLASVQDANQHTTAYTYDVAGRMLTVTAPDTGVTTYTYDGDGNLQTRKDSSNNITTYTYDDAGRLIRVTAPDPDGAGALTPPVTTYAYDLNGNLTATTDPNGNATQTAGDGTTTYAYDRANRLSAINYSDTTPDVTFAYDNAGNRTSMTDGSGMVTYVYDNLGRLTSLTRGSNTFAYGYDAAGNVTSRTYPGSPAVTYAYDEDNRLATVTSGSDVTTYVYDPASNLTQTTLPASNGYIETRAYDRAGRLGEVKTEKPGSLLARFVVSRDPVGNPLRVDRTGSLTETQTYSYDASDRLTSVCFQDACPGAGDPKISWTYDKVGNRLSEQRLSGTTNYTYNALDQLLSAGSTSYTYDNNGDQLSAGSRTFTYDLANRLKTTTSGNTTTTYTYDGDGTRLQASTGSQASRKTNYLWDTSFGLPQVALERDGNNALLRRYTYGARRIAQTTPTSTSYFAYDPLGSTVNLTSASGATQWTWAYEPYGTTRTEAKASGPQPDNYMKFTAEYLDPTGLYHLRARQYDPTIGRFITRDPIESGPATPWTASYVFVGGRPTARLDPSGQRAIPSTASTLAAANASSAAPIDFLVAPIDARPAGPRTCVTTLPRLVYDDDRLKFTVKVQCPLAILWYSIIWRFWTESDGLVSGHDPFTFNWGKSAIKWSHRFDETFRPSGRFRLGGTILAHPVNSLRYVIEPIDFFRPGIL